MNIDELTIADVKQIVAMIGSGGMADHPYVIGANYLIRTVTMIDTGRVVRVTTHEIILKDAAWIADTGRFAQAVATSNFDEVEPFPNGEVIVGRGAVIDACQIAVLPRVQK